MNVEKVTPKSLESERRRNMLSPSAKRDSAKAVLKQKISAADRSVRRSA